MSQLYHFTKKENAVSILKNQKFYFNNAGGHEKLIKYEVYPFINSFSSIYANLEANVKGKLKSILDLKESDNEYDILHALIQHRYNSYVCCFTTNTDLPGDDYAVGFKFDFGKKPCITQSSQAHEKQGDKWVRQDMVTKVVMRYEDGKLQEQLTNICDSFTPVKAIHKVHAIMKLNNIIDSFKHNDFNSENEERILVYCNSGGNSKNRFYDNSYSINKHLKWAICKKKPYLMLANNESLKEVLVRREKDTEAFEKIIRGKKLNIPVTVI